MSQSTGGNGHSCDETLNLRNPQPTRRPGQETSDWLKLNTLSAEPKANEPNTGAAPPLQPPLELVEHPRYEILEPLGKGGMGAVFKARDKVMGRTVAIKVIGGGPQDQALIDRFHREVTILASLAHPNVVMAHDAGQAGSTHYLVMEYVEGVTLLQVLENIGRLPLADACELIRQACLGLQHVHERGLVHRDLKPANLLLTPEGQVKILDLGLARMQGTHAVPAEKGLTSNQQVLGTLDYMAPEQWNNSSTVDIRADIYALGCTLYTLLAGQAPFEHLQENTVFKKMVAHISMPVPPITQFRPETPDGMAHLLNRLLAKEPADRFQQPIEVAKALDAFCRGSNLRELLKKSLDRRLRLLQPAPPVAPIPAPPGPPSRRALLRWGLATATVAAVGAGGLAAWWNWPWLPALAAKPTVPVPPAGEPIRVGVLHSLSGTMAISESPVVDATQLAIDELNERGGLLGQPVQAIVADGESSWDRFAAEAERLIVQEKVAAVFGCWTSASRKTVRPIFEKHRHLLFYPVQYEGLEQSPNIVYLGAAPNQQLLPAVPWCLGNLGRKFFLVGSDYIFPRLANLLLKEEIARRGAEVVGEEYLLLGSTSVNDVVRKIQSAQPQVILNTINGDTNVAFFRALRGAGVTSAKIPTVSFSIGEEELRRLGLANMVGDYAVWNYFQSIESPENAGFVSRFQRKFGRQRVTTDPMEAAYAGVMLWAMAVAKCGSTEPGRVREALAGLSLQAPEGELKIDPGNYHAWKVVRLGRITDKGQFEIIWRSEKPVAPVPYPPNRSPEEWEQKVEELRQQWRGAWANPG